jgi:hypothetical protein
MMNREQFKRHANLWFHERRKIPEWIQVKDEVDDDEHVIWNAEKFNPDNRFFCQWFVCVKPFMLQEDKDEYWEWCNKNLTGKITCFSSSTDSMEEWWGFTEKQDILIWLLRWN